MGSMSAWHWVLVVAIALLLFGSRTMFSDLMGDAAKGLRAFKRGLSDPDETPAMRD